MPFSQKDVQILRDCARVIREASQKPEQEQKINRWYDHNDLKRGAQPMVFCDPEGGWREIVPQESLLCGDKAARRIEWELRIRMFYTKMNHDRVDNARYRIGTTAKNTGWGLSRNTESTDPNGSYKWEGGLENLDDDLNKLHFPEITPDFEATKQNFDFYNDLFDGILEIEVAPSWWWTLGLTQEVIFFRGLEQFFYDMVDNPEGLHRLMKFMSDGTMYILDRLESQSLLASNWQDSYVGSGGFGFTRDLPRSDFSGRVRLCDMWGFCESQETVSVSPAMFEEFVFQYQMPIMKRFGLMCYGCCEPLDTRWHLIEKTPNLRRVSVSAWANFENMAEKLGPDYVFSAKPNPALVAQKNIDENEIRTYLRRIVNAAKKNGCRLELILKDCHTIGGNPDNILRWCEIAKEETADY